MKYIFCMLFFMASTASAEDVILKTFNTCNLSTVVTASSMRRVKHCLVDKVIRRGRSSYPIYLVVNSPGGSLSAGLSFIDFAKTIRNLHTVTLNAASMASAIVQHLPGKRYASDNSTMMFHRARATISGQVDNGELESRLNLLKRVIRKAEMVQAKRMFITLKTYKKRVVNEWWLYSGDLIKYNAIDKMVTVKCTANLIKQNYEIVKKTIFGTFTVKKSKCELVN